MIVAFVWPSLRVRWRGRRERAGFADGGGIGLEVGSSSMAGMMKGGLFKGIGELVGFKTLGSEVYGL